MFSVAKIYSKDIYILLEFSISDLQLLSKALSLANITYNSEVQEEKEAVEFLTDFSLKLNELIGDIKNVSTGPSKTS